MTEAPDAPTIIDEDAVESPYFQFHDTFETEPAEGIELDKTKNRLLTIHPNHGMVCNYAIRASDLKVDRSVQIWLLSASALVVGQDFVVFLTHPYGKLVKATRLGKVVDVYDIWHRFLTSLVLAENYLFVTDRRNDVILQFDLRKPMSESTGQLIGRGFLYRPIDTCVLMLIYLLVVQNDGRVFVFDIMSGFKLTSFGEDTPMIGKVNIVADDTYRTVVLSKETEKCLDVFCLTGFKKIEIQKCQVPLFCHALHLVLNFGPYFTVYSPEMQMVHILERRAKARSQIHSYRLNLHLLSYL